MFSDSNIDIEPNPGIVRTSQVLNLDRELERLSGEGCIALHWPKLPPHSEALNLLLISVARKVQQHSPLLQICSTPDRWSHAATHLIDRGQLPIPPNFGHEITLRRLVRLIEPGTRCLVMGLGDPSADLRAAEHLGEWFSRAAEAGCLILRQTKAAEEPQEPPPAIRPEKGAFRSAAELHLFEALNQDSELRNLFEPNVRILTRFDTTPCVDFLWRDGKVIVEIDSYYIHGRPIVFSDDRQRDYETLVSGYITLRLVDEEINRDRELVLSKVRRVVALRKNKSL